MPPKPARPHASPPLPAASLSAAEGGSPDETADSKAVCKTTCRTAFSSDRRRLLGSMLLGGGLFAGSLGSLLYLRPKVYGEAEFLVFGTRARIRAYADSREQLAAALSASGQQLARQHRRWHAWEAGALGALNQSLAAGDATPLDDDLAEMIGDAQRGYRLSEGLYNPAAGRMIRAWGFHTSVYPVVATAPDAAELAHWRQHPPTMNDLHLAPPTHGGRPIVQSRHPMLALDLNGLAEGYAAQQLRTLLHTHAIADALIDLGGFVLAMGQQHGKPWQVGARGPHGLLGTLALHDGEVLSSSGDYLRYRTVGSRNTPQPGGAGMRDKPPETIPAGAGHILDPRSGSPQRNSTAACVLSRDPVLADMASTALVVAGCTGAAPLIARMGLRHALLLAHDGSTLTTPAWRERMYKVHST